MSEQTGNLTFGIIKPDAVRAGKTGAVLQRILDAGFKVRAMKLIHLTKPEPRASTGPSTASAPVLASLRIHVSAVRRPGPG